MAKKSELLNEIDLIIEKLNNSIQYTYSTSELWCAIIKNNDVVIDWSAEYLTIYGKTSIHQRQIAYNNDVGWNKSWLVVADAINNPFILDVERGQILYAQHGIGYWTTIEISNNIKNFLHIIKIYIETYYIDFQENILDKDYEVNSNFIEELTYKLHKICTRNQINNFVKSIFG
ncbi:hypothetical protein A4G20_10750 [Pasteurellaceae bacterium RH1A]|nr:hypothetical protein A4G20_10750 [Pasteurellaceae bacterium RH1A]